MDGGGRAMDNVFVERLWRSVKYEEVYLKDYVDGWHRWRATSTSTGIAACIMHSATARPAKSTGKAPQATRHETTKSTDVARNTGEDPTTIKPFTATAAARDLGRVSRAASPVTLHLIQGPKLSNTWGSPQVYGIVGLVLLNSLSRFGEPL